MLVRRSVKINGLENKVSFIGSQTKVEQILPLADLFLLPSEEESFGLAALEALACGVPVIGSSGTGLVEVVDHGVDGFLFPVGDTWSMANAGISLLTGEYNLDEFRQRASEKARNQFDADKIVDQYEEIYRN